jgi:pimeloyl-ACP methyl ester carboxylesterase
MQVGLIVIGNVLFVLALAALGYRHLRRRRVAATLRITSPNGIVDERFVRIGGIDQWIQIRGEDRGNPPLLILHGGPGWPNSVFTPVLRSWEKHFTVVQWDMRGTSKTLRRNGKAGSGEMTFGRRVADAVELTEFLRQHLGQDKVILLAESMGTLVGAPLIKRRPDLFSAYVATDLYVDMVRNEAVKYQLTLDRLRAAGNAKGIAALERIEPDPARWTLQEWSVNMGWAFKTNLPRPGLERSLLFPLVFFNPGYRLRDIFHLFVGFQFCTVKLYDEMMAFDARRLGNGFEVPFFLLQGESDVVTVTTLAEEYFAEVEAPRKGLALIRNAGHFAAFTQPEQFLTELLTRVRPAGAPVGHDRAGLEEPQPQVLG